MLESIEQLFFSVDFVSATIRLSVPLVFLSVGELFAERSGVVNIGLEGMMLFGAFAAVAGTFASGNAWVGVFFAMIAGVIFAVILAYVAVSLAGDQIVTGIALNIAALGLTTFLSRTLWGVGKNPKVAGFKPIEVSGLTDLPFVGEILFHHAPLAYVAFLILPVATWILFRTRWGLHINAVGEYPRAADSLGISVLGVRYLTIMISGALAGIGGAYLSITQLDSFVEGMTGGRGFIALAIVIVAKWFPYRAAGVALLFGAIEALSLRMEALGFPVSFHILRMLPYVLTLLVYAGVVGKTRAPAAITIP
ncbi:MAG: ABC transporter permease [Nitrospinota bacterium]